MAKKSVHIPSLADEVVQVIRDFNPWWLSGKLKKVPPAYRRRGTQGLVSRLSRSKGLIEVLRGPRQVGKTTAIEQAIQQLLKDGVRPSDILFLRLDQEILRGNKGGLLPILKWYESEIRSRSFETGNNSFVFLDEVHKLERWDEDVKHLWDTYPIRVLITGSSSVLVSRGGRESLAGRTVTTDFPTFQFREVLEAWDPVTSILPKFHTFNELFDVDDPREVFGGIQTLQIQQKLSLKRKLERYFSRGGYPRLHNGDVSDDGWADYLTEAVIDRVLGVDVPDLFPVKNPQLLRWLYVEVARATGQEVKQTRLAQDATEAGFATSQPIVGAYLHYLADALLIRDYRRYPTGKRTNTRMPSKLTLTDLGPRNALFRGAPSLWESSPEHIGPLVETLAQSVIRGPNTQVHFFRDYENPKDRRTPIREVDFIAESIAGEVVPIEIKFRNSIGESDFIGLNTFRKRFKPSYSLMVTREHYEWLPERKVLCVPILDFLLAF